MSLPNLVFLSIFSINTCAAQPKDSSQDETEAELLSTIQNASSKAEQAEAKLNLGEKYRLKGRLREARVLFEDTAKNFPNQQTKPAAIIGISLINAEQNISSNIIATLQLYIEEDSILRTQKADLFRILSLDAKNKNDIESARYYAERAWENSSSETTARLRKELGPRDQGTETPATQTEENNLEPIRRYEKGAYHDRM